MAGVAGGRVVSLPAAVHSESIVFRRHI